MNSTYIASLKKNLEIELLESMIEEKSEIQCTIESIDDFSGAHSKLDVEVFFAENRDSFYLREFPGNCSWLCASDIRYNIKPKLKVAELIASVLKYAYVFTSIPVVWEEQSIYLESNGYKKIHENYNHHSGREVALYIKEIPQE
jgi:hypothetical protein